MEKSAYKIYWFFVFPIKGAFSQKDKRKFINEGFVFWKRSAARHTIDTNKVKNILQSIKGLEKQYCCFYITDRQFGKIQSYTLNYEEIVAVATQKQFDDGFNI